MIKSISQSSKAGTTRGLYTSPVILLPGSKRWGPYRVAARGGVTNLNRFARRGKQWLLMKLSFACQRDRHLSFFAVHLAGQDALPVSDRRQGGGRHAQHTSFFCRQGLCSEGSSLGEDDGS
ncbi:hypothetical protein NC651_035651 [Populus alba x Populus x berolinensis]|nr:hypothetical protein NC651_035651 [Populus alba x Populus x berolinensis]